MNVSKNIEKSAQRFFPDAPAMQRAFIDALINGTAQEKAAIVLDGDIHAQLPTAPPFPWHPSWAVRFNGEIQVGKLPAHEKGQLYALDLSSVFAASILQEIPFQNPPYIFDLCASPGGKGIFAWKLFQPRLLVANEVVHKRIAPLISNLKRCNIRPAYITSKEPEFFADEFPAMASIVLVDAPCSGQSLLAKGEGEAGAFHPATINMNANRQKRIIANASSLVCDGGYLAYMTCTFSPDENEKVLAWFLKKFPMFSPVASERLKEFQSTYTDMPCYRLWPQSGIGAGAFTALFKKDGDYTPRLFDEVESITPVYLLSREVPTQAE